MERDWDKLQTNHNTHKKKHRIKFSKKKKRMLTCRSHNTLFIRSISVSWLWKQIHRERVCKKKIHNKKKSRRSTQKKNKTSNVTMIKNTTVELTVIMVTRKRARKKKKKTKMKKNSVLSEISFVIITIITLVFSFLCGHTQLHFVSHSFTKFFDLVCDGGRCARNKKAKMVVSLL